MVTSKLFRFGLGILGAVALGAFTLPAAPAKADNFAFGYSSGYSPRHFHGHDHFRGHRDHFGAGFVYVAPPPYYYYPPPPPVYYAPPPRVVYVNPPPPPVYYSAPPVVYQAPQTLPGGPLAASQPQCREYQSTAVVNGQQVPSYGTACLQEDGSWQIVR
jgi:hypothetical protein